MSVYRITVPVTKATGFQSYMVIASSEEEALALHEQGKSEFEAEEVEVYDTGKPSAARVEV